MQFIKTRIIGGLFLSINLPPFFSCLDCKSLSFSLSLVLFSIAPSCANIFTIF